MGNLDNQIGLLTQQSIVGICDFWATAPRCRLSLQGGFYYLIYLVNLLI